jgi:uncharacterized protein (DUF1330 family)
LAAYLIAQVDIKDMQAYRAYMARTPALIAKYNGRILARGGEVASLEGEPCNSRVVIIEFSSLEQAKRFYESSDYQEVKLLRDGCSTARFFAVQGVESATT